jgi:hypothetical protein
MLHKQVISRHAKERIVMHTFYAQIIAKCKNWHEIFFFWAESDEPWIVPKELRRFKLQELEKATNNFDENCYTGSGGFGKVYRGVLFDGTIVALKCASQHSAQGQTQFRNELTLLSRLHHRNLVKLEGFCDDDGLQVPYSHLNTCWVIVN